MAAKRTKRKRSVKASYEEPIRERKRAPEKSTAMRGGPKSKAGTIKEDKRTPKEGAPEKNIRKDHDKASYELEASEGRPSRKSTRRGANRVKPDSQLKRRATRATRSPQSRHAMRGG